MSSTWQTVDDTDPLLLYLPESNWRLDNFVPGPNVNEGSTHTAVGDGSTVIIRFSGTAIIVYTYIRPNAANFTAELDGRSTFVQTDPTSVNTTQPSVTWGDLEDGEHTLVLRKSRNDPVRGRNVLGVDQSYLSLDYVQIKGTLLEPLPVAPASVGSSGTPRPSRSQHSLPVGAIVGIVLGALVAFFFFAALAYYQSRRKRRVPDIGGVQPFVHRKSRASAKTIEHRATYRNGRHASGGVPVFNSAGATFNSLSRSTRSPLVPSPDRVSPKGSAPSPASPKTPFTSESLLLPEQARIPSNRRSGRAGGVCRGVLSWNALNIRGSRMFQSGNKRSSDELLELPGHCFIRVSSPPIDLSSPVSSRTSPGSRAPAGGYLSPSTSSSAFSGISGLIIPDFPLPPRLSNQYLHPETPFHLPAGLHKVKKVRFRSSVASYKSMSQAGSDIGSHSYPASPVRSTILRHFVDYHDGNEAPSSPIGSSIIMPPSIVPSSCAVPADQLV